MSDDFGSTTFENYKKALEQKFSRDVYASWIKPLGFVDFDGRHLQLHAPSRHSANQVKSRYGVQLKKVFEAEVGPLERISVCGMKSIQGYSEASIAKTAVSEKSVQGLMGQGLGGQNLGGQNCPTPRGADQTASVSDISGPSTARLSRHLNENAVLPYAGKVSASGGAAATRSTVAIKPSQSEYVEPESSEIEAPQNALSSEPAAVSVDTHNMSRMAATLNDQLTFNRFCVGASNSMAFVAARNIVEGSDDRLIYLHGNSGRGKSHLLCAIGHEWNARKPSQNVLYLTYDNMLNGYVNAVMSKTVSELRHYLDQIDLVLVDDVHLLRGRISTQEELLCFLDRVRSCGKIAVVAGGMAPSVLAETGINPRLADRLAGGLCVGIEAPDYDVRRKILDQMADHYAGFGENRVPATHLDVIARRCDGSVRELEGAFRLIRLSQQAAVNLKDGGPMDDDQVRAMLNQHLKRHRKEITLDLIKEKVADKFGVNMREIEGRRRLQPIAKARHAYCLLARKLTDAPLKQIGATISRDHTTVISSIERAEALATRNPEFADRISALIEDIE